MFSHATGGACACVTTETVPETVAPFAGEVIRTALPGAGVGVAVAVREAVGAGVDVGVRVGVAPFATVTVRSEERRVGIECRPWTRMECEPLGTVTESQENLYGGDDTRYLPSM